jgi:hypothetical protein
MEGSFRCNGLRRRGDLQAARDRGLFWRLQRYVTVTGVIITWTTAQPTFVLRRPFAKRSAGVLSDVESYISGWGAVDAGAEPIVTVILPAGASMSTLCLCAQLGRLARNLRMKREDLQ